MDANAFKDANGLAPCLHFMVQAQASDLFPTVSAPSSAKLHGVVRPMSLPP